jgi:hypothetical protein
MHLQWVHVSHAFDVISLTDREIRGMIVQSGLDNPKFNSPDPRWTEVKRGVQFNRYVCGVNLFTRVFDCVLQRDAKGGRVEEGGKQAAAGYQNAHAGSRPSNAGQHRTQQYVVSTCLSEYLTVC